jgi:hypothetical protein
MHGVSDLTGNKRIFVSAYDRSGGLPEAAPVHLHPWHLCLLPDFEVVFDFLPMIMLFMIRNFALLAVQ